MIKMSNFFMRPLSEAAVKAKQAVPRIESQLTKVKEHTQPHVEKTVKKLEEEHGKMPARYTKKRAVVQKRISNLGRSVGHAEEVLGNRLSTHKKELEANSAWNRLHKGRAAVAGTGGLLAVGAYKHKDKEMNKNAFWTGFEKQALTRFTKELVKNPSLFKSKSLTNPMREASKKDWIHKGSDSARQVAQSGDKTMGKTQELISKKLESAPKEVKTMAASNMSKELFPGVGAGRSREKLTARREYEGGMREKRREANLPAKDIGRHGSNSTMSAQEYLGSKK